MPVIGISSETTTLLLTRIGAGDADASAQLLPLVYEELRAIADRYMREQRPGHTLQTTALVNEAYLRMVGKKDQSWESRSHFLGVAALAMRSVLVDHARRKHALKRDGERVRIPLEGAAILTDDPAADVLAIDEALTRLSKIDPRKARIVELRFFGGLDIDETAEMLDASSATVKREWRFARAWLHRELTGESPDA